MSRGREQLTLGEPLDDPSALSDFPDRRLDAGQTLYRATERGFGVWWFSSSRRGRFNLSPPHGTCYLALDQLTAILEALGPRLGGPVSSAFLDDTVVHAVALPHAVRPADTTALGSLRLGVTPEISTVVPYGLAQRWAAAWSRAGFDGVVYWARHDPRRVECLALFGEAGARDWPEGTDREIDGELIEQLEAECGLKILKIPTLDQIETV